MEFLMCLFQYNEFFRQVIGLLKQSLAKKGKEKNKNKNKNPTDFGSSTIHQKEHLNITEAQSIKILHLGVIFFK